MKIIITLAAVVVSLVSVVTPISAASARYAGGEGSISLINDTTGYSPYTISASDRTGGGFFGDTLAYQGRFDLRFYIPDAYLSGHLTFYSISGDFAEGSTGIVKMYTSADLYPTPARQGTFTLSSFARDPDGVVSLFNASFDQQVIYSLCPLIETLWQGELTYHSVPTSIAPEPTTMSLMLAGVLVLAGIRRR